MLSKYVHDTLGIVTLSQSRRVVRVSISVRPSGEVRVSYPTSISTRRALEFLESKRDWIERTKERLAQHATLTHTPEQIEEMIKSGQFPQAIHVLAYQMIKL